jgi:AcrR family transcriptional regulator
LGVTQPLLYQYFPAKRDPIDAVYDRIDLHRLKPHWPTLIGDRSRPILERMTHFYREYADAVLSREWVRLFEYAGLQGEDINDRYLKKLDRTIIRPLLEKISFAARQRGGASAKVPKIDDIWTHHGSIFYFGIREHIYGVKGLSDRQKMIETSVARFIGAFITADVVHHRRGSQKET